MYVLAVQGLTLLIPLITTPWILRALRPEAYGIYTIALALIQYAVILVDFGFYLAATRQIAQIRYDREKLTRYFWNVQIARTVLAVSSAALVVAVVLSVPKLRPMLVVVAANLPMLLGTLLYPQWLFLGLERIRSVSLVNIAARILSAIPIFLLVHGPDDAAVAAFLSSCNILIAGLFATAIIKRSHIVGAMVKPRLEELRAVYRDAWPLFVSSMAFSLYSTSNSVILGLVRDNYEVGLFGAADRLRQASITPAIAISTVFFPRISRLLAENKQRAVQVIGLTTFVLAAGGAAMSVLVFLLSPYLVRIFTGGSFTGAVPVLQILSIIPFLTGLNTAFGPLILVNFNMAKQCSRVIVVCGLTNVAMLPLLSILLGARGAAISLVATETLVACCLGLLVRRCGITEDAIRGVVLALRLRQ